MEIESKYKVIGPLDPAAVSRLDLAPYALRPGEQLAHHDVLLDTPERAITRSRHALRLRNENGATILTFKGPAAVEGSVHSREEVEARLKTNSKANGNVGNEVTALTNGERETYDYHTWPKKIARRVEKLVGSSEELRPLLEVVVNRRTWIVEHGDKQVGELALDEGTILAGGASEPVHELELELKQHGTPDDLAALDERLQATLPLAAEPHSKLERGLALLNSRTKAPGTASEDQSPSNAFDTQSRPDREEHNADDWTGHTPLQLAARQAVGGFLKKIRQHEPAVREGHDSDAIHDMRVATRRLRSALDLLEYAPGFSAKKLHLLRRHLRKLARSLGAVRDLDVFLKRLEDYEDEHPGAKDGLHPLHHTLEHRRASARRKLLRALESTKLRHDLDQVETFATETVDSFGEPRPVLVRHFAGSALWRRYEVVLRFESEIVEAPAPELHKLRIACKRARYAMELFEPALGDEAKAVEDALIAVQDHLGALQDSVVALATVEEVRRGRHVAHDEVADAALAAYAADLAARRDHLRETFAPLWERISGGPFRDRLATLISRL